LFVGGYGWIIVIVGFIVSVLIDGSIYSFGIFFPVYIDFFGQNPATVSWVGSISSGGISNVFQFKKN